MKQADLLKLALLGLTAGVCLSAQSATTRNAKEIAMTKCSKETPSGDAEMPDDENSNGQSSCNGHTSCNGQNGCNSNVKGQKNGKTPQQTSSKGDQMKKKRISAAQSVIEYENGFEQHE